MTEIQGQAILKLEDHPWASMLKRNWRIDIRGTSDGTYRSDSISIDDVCVHPRWDDLVQCKSHPRPPLSADDSVTAERKCIALGSLLAVQMIGASAFLSRETLEDGFAVISYRESDLLEKPKPRHPKRVVPTDSDRPKIFESFQISRTALLVDPRTYTEIRNRGILALDVNADEFPWALEVTAGDEIEVVSDTQVESGGTVLTAAVRAVHLREELDAFGKLLPIALLSLEVVAL
jgi:hypothetical protein